MNSSMSEASAPTESKLTGPFFAQLASQGSKEVIKWCMDFGILANKYSCPTCNKGMALNSRSNSSDGLQWVCSTYGENAHIISRSIRTGTWFAESRLTLVQILLITYYWVCKLPGEFIANDVGVRAATIVGWKACCREICHQMMVKNPEMIGGDCTIVEVDETKFGKGSKGKKSNVNLVLGGVERGTNNCFFKVVAKTSKDLLLQTIKEFIRPGTTIVSNCWKSHDCLKDERFIRLAEKNTYHFKSTDAETHNNTIVGTWSAIKRSLSARTAADKFDSYLAEYMWRKRHSGETGSELMASFLRDLKIVHKPATQD